MEKWTLPKGPPPSWLDVADEITHDNTPRYPIDRFIVECMEACLRIGCSPKQAAGVTANVRNESANGQRYRCFNLYGWKITEAYTKEYRESHGGKGPPWWCAPGNKAPGATLEDLKGGDPPWCYYRVFESFDGSLAEWIRHYVPKPSDPAPYGPYRTCGKLFWSDREWFPELVRVGYKGEDTRKHPESAIVEHLSLAKTSLIRWVQSRFHATVDGIWGRESETLCAAYQSLHNLAVTGQITDETLVMLAS